MIMHKNTLKISFISRQCNGWPTVNIFIDDDLYEEAHLNKESFEIEIPIQLEDRLHKLEIEHFGKTNKNTKIDSNGNIIQDLSFEIEKIEIQNLTVPEYMMRTNIFVPNWIDLTEPTNFPKVLKQSNRVGPNGIWSLQFKTPFEDHLINRNLDKMLDDEKKALDTFESYEPDSHSTIQSLITEEEKKLFKDIKDLLK